MKQVLFTKKGFEKFKKAISSLEDKVRSIQASTQETLELGGNLWHDNASYEHLKEDLAVADRRLKEAYQIYNKSTIVEYPSRVDNVCYGSEVKVVVDGEEKTYQIVGYYDDASENMMFYGAPLSQAFILHKPGDEYDANVNGLKRHIRILDVKPILSNHD